MLTADDELADTFLKIFDVNNVDVMPHPIPIAHLAKEQETDPACISLRKQLIKTPNLPFADRDGILYFTKTTPTNTNPVPVLPRSLVNEVLTRFHASALSGAYHFGQRATFARIRHYFYWRKMSNDIFQFVSNCQIC